MLALSTFVLGRLRFGRYVYAIGGNAEAARRAGIDLRMIRTTAFMLCSFTARIAALVLLIAVTLDAMARRNRPAGL